LLSGYSQKKEGFMKLLAYILLAKVVLGLCVLLVWSDSACHLFLCALPWLLGALGLGMVYLLLFCLATVSKRSDEAMELECWRKFHTR
jgi:hypothetical protein